MNENDWENYNHVIDGLRHILRHLGVEKYGKRNRCATNRKLALWVSAIRKKCRILTVYSNYESWKTGDVSENEVDDLIEICNSYTYSEHTTVSKIERINLLVDVIGNPFKRLTFDNCPRCTTDDMTERREKKLLCFGCDGEFNFHRFLTDSVLSLAQEMYDRDDYSDMPILSDALQDAGCDNEEIMNHVKKQNHIRGCWLTDIILGYK